MSGVSVRVEDKGVRRALDELASRVKDMRPAFEDIGFALTSLIDLNWRAERDPWGVQWKALQTSTVKARRQGGAGAKILDDTHRLASSITYKAEPFALSIGTNVVYGATHQFGRGGIPIRAFLPMRPGPVADLPEEWNAIIAASVSRHLARGR